jgi:hypothetical protein
VKEINSQEEINGSNPSLCAHLEEISVRFETYGYQRSAKVVKAGTRGRRPISTTASSFNDTAVVCVINERRRTSQKRRREGYRRRKNNPVFLEVTDLCGFI